MQNDRSTSSPLEQEHGTEFGGGPVLDRGAFGALEELAGDDDPDLITDLVGLYLEDSATRMGEVEAGVNSSEPGRVGSAAHALKSASANIGALSFSKVCAELEACARSADAMNLEELERLCTRALAMYTEVCATLGAFGSTD